MTLVNFQKIKSAPRYSFLTIPKDWKYEELGEIVDFVRGVSYTSPEVNSEENGSFFVNLNCFNEGGGFIDKGLLYFNGETKKLPIQSGDIVIAVTEVTLKGKIIGYPLIVPKSPNKSKIHHSLDTAHLKFKRDKIDQKFLFYFLSSELYHKSILAYSAGSTVLHLHVDSIKKILVPIPPVEEQTQISLILSHVDTLQEQANKIAKHSQFLKKIMIEELLSKGIKHEKFQNVQLKARFHKIKIPKKWSLMKLDDICTITDTPHYTSPKSDNGVPVITTSQCTTFGKIDYSKANFTSFEEYQKRKKSIDPDVDDILFTREAPFGIAVHVDKKEIAVGQRIILIKTNSNILNSQFLLYFLNSKQGKKQSLSLAIRTTVERLNIHDIRQFLIPIPPIEEQEEIVSILSKFDVMIEFLTNYENQLKSIKKGLMQKLLTGEVRVKV